MSKSKKAISMQDKGQEGLLALLEEAQDKLGYLSSDALTDIAKSLGLSISDVYGVATFYSFLSTQPRGRNIIRICKSLPCFLKKYQNIIKRIEKEIGIKPGETTPDGRFSFELTNCIGACDKAPAMMINEDVYLDLTPNKVSQILKSYE